MKVFWVRYLTLGLPNIQVSYENNDENIQLSFYKKEQLSHSVALKKHAKVGDIITIDKNSDNECKIENHFQQISLYNVQYFNVLKVNCHEEYIAYFQGTTGLIASNDISTISQLSTLENIDEETIPLASGINIGTLNYEGVEMSQADKIQQAPYNLTGKGVAVGIIDVGAVRESHQEFLNENNTSRITNLTTRDYSSHTSHIAGTIAAKGVDPLAKGYAAETLISVNSMYDMKYYNAMEMFAEKDIYITNNSYGIAKRYNVGVYDGRAISMDIAISKNDYLIGIFAAGNDGDNVVEYDYYGSIKSAVTAKNIITVGSVDNQYQKSPFSSTGPAQKHRIKPDIVAKGSQVYSTSYEDDTGYLTMDGTSMATPAVTGMMSLLQEYYFKINNNEKMRADVAKNIIIHSAVDLGRKGPDYEYGFGLINALSAVKLIETMNTDNNLIIMDEVSQEQSHVYDLNIDEEVDFIATLSWLDAATIFNTPEVLWTDLDLYIKDSNGDIIYSYTLDGENPEEEATQDRFNRADNTEKIETKLSAGSYKLYVKIHAMKNSKVQKYSLITSEKLGAKSTEVSYLPMDEIESVIYDSVFGGGVQ